MSIVGNITVDIPETYEGSCWRRLTIHLPGYGADHKGFVMLDIEAIEKYLGPNWRGDVQPALFRPEYAKEIKRRLETPPCSHNRMVERVNDPQFAWECADCGHVFGKLADR